MAPRCRGSSAGNEEAKRAHPLVSREDVIITTSGADEEKPEQPRPYAAEDEPSHPKICEGKEASGWQKATANGALSERAWLLDDNVAPGQTMSRAGEGGPVLDKPEADGDESVQARLFANNSKSGCKGSATSVSIPKWQVLLEDNAEARFTTSRTASELPTRARPNTDKALSGC
eukprot:TRINITY_DN14554_c0_g1_i3.p3 TRINITY_DN14554_c0_g1~~TRINITY_DN14554_c0_g1_i3.p3  ORF type:complete len:174 (-),score=21.31 TRINITY_DN14554_c0_g1_i3:372-893(-)